MNDFKFRISRIIDRLSRGFVGRASIVLSGSVIGYGITFLLLPLITRIYSAENLGIAASTLAIFNMLSILICFQYEQAIIVATDEEVPYLIILGLSLTWGWVLFIGFVLLIIDVLFPVGLIYLMSNGFNLLLPILLLTYAPFVLLVQFYLRKNKLKKVSGARFIYYGVGTIVQVITGYLFGGTASVFLITQVAIALLTTIYLIPYRPLSYWISCHITTPARVLSNVKRVANKYKNFPKYQAESQFVNAVSAQILVLAMRAAFSADWAGWYFLANRLLSTPVAVVSQAVGQVFFRDSAERERTGLDQKKILENAVVNLIKISLFPALILGIIIPVLIPLFAGKSWEPVGLIIQIMIPMYIIGFFTSPITTLYNLRNLQSKAFVFFNLLLLVRVMAILIGVFIGSAIGTIWLFSILSVIALFLFPFYIVRHFGGSWKTIFLNTIPILGESILILIVAIILNSNGKLYTIWGLIVVCFLFSLCLFYELRKVIRSHHLAQA